MSMAVGTIALSCDGAAQGQWTPPPVTGYPVLQQPGAVPAGTVVPSRDLDTRSFLDRLHGYALAFIDNGQYPARTVNGGKTWRVDGPVFHMNAAQGGGGVGQMGVPSHEAGVASDNTAYAWGGATPDRVVVVTTDGGKRWWGALFPGLVLFVGNTDGHLVANVYGSVKQGHRTRTGLWAYSTKTGRQWTYSYSLGPQ